MPNNPKEVLASCIGPAAQRRAGSLCDALASLGATVFRVCLDAKDPGSASPDEVRELRRRFLD